MNVLIACEESQTICKEMRRLGNNAFSCDIVECSGGHPEWHIMHDVTDLINGNCKFETMDGTLHTVNGEWDLLIAHPPCTYITNAGARWLFAGGVLNEERYKKGLKAKDFFMMFYNADCDKIAIENPVPSHIYNLPDYSQVIQPYMFGHKVTKRTCLWLKGLPKLIETDNIGAPEKRYYKRKDGTYRTKCWEMEQDKHDHGKSRSKTFEGIAKAMAEQWAGNCNGNGGAY